MSSASNWLTFTLRDLHLPHAQQHYLFRSETFLVSPDKLVHSYRQCPYLSG